MTAASERRDGQAELIPALGREAGISQATARGMGAVGVVVVRPDVVTPPRTDGAEVSDGVE